MTHTDTIRRMARRVVKCFKRAVEFFNEDDPITWKESLKAVCELAVRVERLEGYLLEFYKAVQASDEFQTYEILKTQMDILNYSKKTPFRRLEELEQSLKGFITHYYENQKETKPPAYTIK